ncbi:MAG TPA: class I SAM-dependent methyltransferase [Burkholderiales bacterium]|jgi:SAM-dependent methyltransferase|nr:class I SAM-dependent methyltransferase [Burkholderiales bacterium]
MSRALPPESSTTRWYATHIRRYGYGYRALGFGHRSSQEKRFGALLGLGAFHGRSVLDAGCGFGDFLAFLQERGMSPQYTGFDLCAPMVERCRKRFAEKDASARFLVGDALTFADGAPYDYVVASGIFGLAARGTRARIRPTVTRLFGMCRQGLAVNFLSARAPRRSTARVYVEPAEMLELGLSLTPAARLDHSYLPNDFTLLLHRTPPWLGENASEDAS